jgi:hypothetical protein
MTGKLSSVIAWNFQSAGNNAVTLSEVEGRLEDDSETLHGNGGTQVREMPIRFRSG